ncbi:hypothetical protein OF83DRAFT_1087126 [Amylostereum chailletii]|nr:hypothetical protein OF83DRAFT_1087126 [Amylostereum chailletii]
MFPRALLLVLLFSTQAFAHSAKAVSAGKKSSVSSVNQLAAASSCAPPSVTVTVTATAGAAAATGSAAAPITAAKGKGANNAGAAAGSNAGKNNGAATGKNAGTASSAAGGNKGGSAVRTTSVASAASTTSAASAASTSAAAGAASGSAPAASGPQAALTLDPKVLATGFEKTGQETPTAGQVASLTSANNFINFCLTAPNLPISNGQQFKTGACNPAPMGIMPASTLMPSSKFTSPTNLATIQANTPFLIQMAVKNIEMGNFVNPQTNYYAAPQHLNDQGIIIGHSHVVVEALDSLTQTTPTDPTKFAFFKGVNTPAVNGVVTVNVTEGVPAGVYKLSSLNAAMNHQPVLVPIAQHGSLDDVVYFTVTADGKAAASGNTAASGSTAASGKAATTAAASTATAAAGKGAKAAKGKGKREDSPLASRAPRRFGRDY